VTKLAELASELSSKNAGNFHVVFDIVFDDDKTYQRAKTSGVFTRERIAHLYQAPTDEVLDIIYFDPGHAIKISMKRLHASGDPGETDVFGAQQYPPLLGLEIP
jgi:hypothetical protein